MLKIKNLEPRNGYFCAIMRFLWRYNLDIIGKNVDIYEVEGG